MVAVEPPRRIRHDDPLDKFTCGNPALDEWLAKHASRAEKARTAITYICASEAGVAGYYSLCGHSIRRNDVGGGWLARNTPNPIPAVLLARLAVGKSFQGQGLGWSLLQHAVLICERAAELIGLRALVVDPIDAAAASFYEHFGFRAFPGNPDRMFIKL
ncbi:MAG: GNAT family N-acetyltransferase [Propionibacteriaceae bacterium]|jgi:GNAT superfamily N-acetyltransferase|nr:GNAT family N-acetyltransferase [Propionibacteriaceae bacterium]